MKQYTGETAVLSPSRRATPLGHLLLLATVAQFVACSQELRRIQRPETGYAFPAASELTAIRVAHWFHDGRFQAEFDLPPRYWPDVLAALTPSQYDENPCKWISLADLTLVTRDNEVHWVGVFLVDPKSVGAFAAGPTAELRRYYRGGNSSGIEEAIRKGFAEHERKKGGSSDEREDN